MEPMTETLKHCILFGNSSDSELKAISRLITTGDIQEGETLTCKGEKATSFFILVSGILLLEMTDQKAIILDKPGDFAGLDILSRRGTYISTLTALTQSKVLVIKRNDFLDLIQEDTELAGKMMHAWNLHLSESISFFEPPEEETLEELDYQY